MLNTDDDPRRVLKRCLLPQGIDEARNRLSARLETATLYGFCDEYFPRVFRATFPKTWAKDQNKLLPDPQHGRMWSDGELKALEMISNQCIPIAYEYLEESAMGEGEEGEQIRLPTIPLHEFGLDLWDTHGQEHERGWKLLAQLDGGNVSSRDDDLPDDLLALMQVKTVPRGVWSWDLLTQTCALFPEPLSHLPLAIGMLNLSTGNVFLDTNYEIPYENSTWTWEDLTWLAEQWKEAQATMKRAERLAAWLEQHPKRVRKVVDVWNLATWNMLMAGTVEE